MFRDSLLVLGLFAILLLPLSATAEVQTRTIEPIEGDDLTAFKVEGESAWKVDTETDLVDTLVVCTMPKKDTSLIYIQRMFKEGFQVSLQAKGGSKSKGLSFVLLPEKGKRVDVPVKGRSLTKKGWHEVTMIVEEGKAKTRVGDKDGKAVKVPKGPLTFAIKVKKRTEATLRKITIKYVVTTVPQMKPEEGFVRIFDGKTLDGWKLFPEGTSYYKVEDDAITGSLAQGGEHRMAGLVFADAPFKDYTMRFRIAATSKAVILFGRPGEKDQYDPTYARLADHFPGGAEWYDMEFEIAGSKVTLKVGGKQVWTEIARNLKVMRPEFAVGQGGVVKLRDIRVKGQNLRPGPSWDRYVKESGATPQAPPPQEPAPSKQPEGPVPPTPDETWTPAGKELFNGINFVDWGCGPAGVWSIVDRTIKGDTTGRNQAGGLRYTALVFTDYLLKFKVKKGTKGAVFVARLVPKKVAEGKKPIAFEINPGWFVAGEWTEFEVMSYDDLLTVKAGGKQVWVGETHKEKGYIQFEIRGDSVIGLKDLTWDRPPGQKAPEKPEKPEDPDKK